MYEYGLDSETAQRHLDRSMQIIGRINEPARRRWLNSPPSPEGEITRLKGASPQDPVDLSHSLHAAAVTSADAVLQISLALRSPDGFTLGAVRTLLRTALMGAGRVGYVVLPETPEERDRNAAVVLAQEAGSLSRALRDFETFTGLPGLRPTDDQITMLREQIAQHDHKRGRTGDRAMIRRAAELMGIEVARRDPTIDSVALREHLTFIWHTASGAAHGLDWQRASTGDFVSDLGAVTSALSRVLEALEQLWTSSLTA